MGCHLRAKDTYGASNSGSLFTFDNVLWSDSVSDCYSCYYFKYGKLFVDLVMFEFQYLRKNIGWE